MKRILAAFLAPVCWSCPPPPSPGAPETRQGPPSLMEKETGTILYEHHAHDKLEPASVTKVMTAAAGDGGHRLGAAQVWTIWLPSPPTPPPWAAPRSTSKKGSR